MQEKHIYQLHQESIIDIKIKHLFDDRGIYSINVFMIGKTVSCNALMYRDSGKSEEKIEIIWPNKKIIVNDLNTTIEYTNNIEVHKQYDNWAPTLDKRGFSGLINEFLNDISKGNKYLEKDDKSLKTHRLCNAIYQQIITT